MFNRLCKELNEFLAPHYITTTYSDVFEETLLKLAGVKSQPKHCEFANSKSQFAYEINGNEKLAYFRIWRISEHDAELFLNFFKNHGDAQASSEYHEPAKPDCVYIPESYHDTHIFTVNLPNLVEKLLPLFKSEIERLLEESPDALLVYQNNSMKDFKLRKLRILNDLTFVEMKCKFENAEINKAITHLKMAIHEEKSADELIAATKKFASACGDDVLIQRIVKYIDMHAAAMPVEEKPYYYPSYPARETSYFGSLANFFRPLFSQNVSGDEPEDEATATYSKSN
jgi:hypothetical protein